MTQRRTSPKRPTEKARTNSDGGASDLPVARTAMQHSWRFVVFVAGGAAWRRSCARPLKWMDSPGLGLLIVE